MSIPKPAFRVKVRPSRPSGKSTVRSFLSALTTTLQDLKHVKARFNMLKKMRNHCSND